MKIKIPLLCVALAVFAVVGASCSPAEAAGSGKMFVLWDPLLRLPAVCYRLDDGWEGKGSILWNLRGGPPCAAAHAADMAYHSASTSGGFLV